MSVDTGTTGSATPLSAEVRQWFGAQVTELLDDLYGAALRLSGNRTNAEDLVAETIARALASLDTLERRDRLRGWMFCILSNLYVSQRRSARVKHEHEPLDTTEPESFSLFERLHRPFLLFWGNPEQAFLDRLLAEDLRAAIDALPDVFRSVVVMVDVQGMRYREVADALEVPVGTVRSRLSRGRGLLQGALWDHARDAGLCDPTDPNPSEAR